MTETTVTEPDPDSTPPEPASRPSRHSSFRRNAEWVLIVGVAIASALLVKTFLVEAFYIPSGSMETTLRQGDRVLVNKLSYHLHDVRRGDVIVFERPPGASGDPNIHDFIKRVIGLPGDVVESRDDQMYVNGKKLREPYLQAGMRTIPAVPRQRIPAHHYWVMGDNRTNSADSRVFHSIDEASIVGRAFVQVWPLRSVELL